MTFDSYIKNPMGDKNAVMTQREMFRQLYREKLDTILVREANKIDYRIYSVKDNIFYFHIKVPSEVVPKFYYDTVIKFTEPKEILNKGVKNLDNWNVQFYSNDPAFVFTFAHAFIENKLFISELKSKMSKEAVKNIAKDKNPKNQIAYVKSLYFAYLIIKDKGLFSYHFAKAASIPYNEKYLLSQIEDADKKIESRQEEGNKIQKAKSEARKKSSNNIKDKRETSNTGNITQQKFTKIVKPVKSTKGTKSVGNIKPVKNTKVK